MRLVNLVSRVIPEEVGGYVVKTHTEGNLWPVRGTDGRGLLYVSRLGPISRLESAKYALYGRPNHYKFELACYQFASFWFASF